MSSPETNNEGDEGTVLQSLTLPVDLEERLTTFLQEAAAYSEAADDEPLSEADVFHRLLLYALDNLAGKRAFFGKTYVGEVEAP